MTDREKSYSHAFPALDEWFSGRYKVRLADKTPVAISELHEDYLRYTVEHGKRPEKKRALVQYLRKYRQVPVQRHRGVAQYAVGIIKQAGIASTFTQPASILPSDPPPALPASVAALAEAIRSTKAPASPPTTPVYGRRARGFVQLGLTVSRESKDLLRRAAEANYVSMSELLDELLRRYLAEYTAVVKKVKIASTVKGAATPTAKTAERTPSEHQTIQAIETRYKGYRFRSRLEARWAVFFDHLGIEWEYEPQGYVLSDGSTYLPDFWLPKFDRGMYVEVKPNGGDFSKAMQFARELKVKLWMAEGRPGENFAQVYDASWGNPDPWTVEGLPMFNVGQKDHRMYWEPQGHEATKEEKQATYLSMLEWEPDGPLVKAIMAARSARFEHGENGAA